MSRRAQGRQGGEQRGPSALSAATGVADTSPAFLRGDPDLRGEARQLRGIAAEAPPSRLLETWQEAFRGRAKSWNDTLEYWEGQGQNEPFALDILSTKRSTVSNHPTIKQDQGLPRRNIWNDTFQHLKSKHKSKC